MRRYLGLPLLAVGLLTAGSMSNLTGTAPAPGEQPFHEPLKKVAAEYRNYGRIDDEMRWAPFDCRMPMPASAHFSASKDDKTHGQKLYSLFVKDRAAYLKLDVKKPIPVGMAIVKQSWIPEEVPARKFGPFPASSDLIVTPDTKQGKGKGLYLESDHFYPFAQKDGKTFKASKQADLFLMLKLDPKTPGTDNGWVYGTVTPDGKKVTSAGRVESCMKCHQDAKYDRVFGLGK